MTELVQLMSQNSFGYGSWDAPFWFIGPEQGGDRNEKRAKAFAELGHDVGHDGLCDCETFHEAIGESRWHHKPTKNAKLQSTWRRLLMLLMPAIQRGTDHLTLREYQSASWGKRSGETCVIELCGLSARNFRDDIDRRSFRSNRTEKIKQRLERRMANISPPLKMVVMYGSGLKASWREITGVEFEAGKIVGWRNVCLVFMNSPTAVGERDEDWKDAGARIAVQLGTAVR